MEILFLVALVLLNGAFAMSEIALVTARRGRLARLAEDGDGAEKPAKEKAFAGTAARFVTQPGEIEIIKHPTKKVG